MGRAREDIMAGLPEARRARLGTVAAVTGFRWGGEGRRRGAGVVS